MNPFCKWRKKVKTSKKGKYTIVLIIRWGAVVAFPFHSPTLNELRNERELFF